MQWLGVVESYEFLTIDEVTNLIKEIYSNKKDASTNPFE